MAMNLRENKMDKFDTSHQEKLLSTSKKKQYALQQPRERQKIMDGGRSVWVRKEPKEPLPEESFDFQEDVQYEQEHSEYIARYPENVLVSWEGPEFEHYPRDKKWYTGVLLVLCAVILYAIFTDGYLMAIVFILIGVVGYLILSRPQKVIDFAVTYDGLVIGNEIYDYDDIKSFWIFYEPPHTRVISLHMKGRLRPYLHVPLHQVDPVIVHEKLLEFIPEVKQEQNLIDVFERLLRM
jgi:hypothetical protein